MRWLTYRGFDQDGAANGEKMRDNVLRGWPTILAIFQETSNTRSYVVTPKREG